MTFIHFGVLRAQAGSRDHNYKCKYSKYVLQHPDEEEELGRRRGAEMILARLGSQGAEALCEVDREVGGEEDGG